MASTYESLRQDLARTLELIASEHREKFDAQYADIEAGLRRSHPSAFTGDNDPLAAVRKLAALHLKESPGNNDNLVLDELPPSSTPDGDDDAAGGDAPADDGADTSASTSRVIPIKPLNPAIRATEDFDSILRGTLENITRYTAGRSDGKPYSDVCYGRDGKLTTYREELLQILQKQMRFYRAALQKRHEGHIHDLEARIERQHQAWLAAAPDNKAAAKAKEDALKVLLEQVKARGKAEKKQVRSFLSNLYKKKAAEFATVQQTRINLELNALLASKELKVNNPGNNRPGQANFNPNQPGEPISDRQSRTSSSSSSDSNTSTTTQNADGSHSSFIALNGATDDEESTDSNNSTTTNTTRRNFVTDPTKEYEYNAFPAPASDRAGHTPKPAFIRFRYDGTPPNVKVTGVHVYTPSDAPAGTHKKMIELAIDLVSRLPGDNHVTLPPRSRAKSYTLHGLIHADGYSLRDVVRTACIRRGIPMRALGKKDQKSIQQARAKHKASPKTSGLFWLFGTPPNQAKDVSFRDKDYERHPAICRAEQRLEELIFLLRNEIDQPLSKSLPKEFTSRTSNNPNGWREQNSWLNVFFPGVKTHERPRVVDRNNIRLFQLNANSQNAGVRRAPEHNDLLDMLLILQAALKRASIQGSSLDDKLLKENGELLLPPAKLTIRDAYKIADALSTKLFGLSPLPAIRAADRQQNSQPTTRQQQDEELNQFWQHFKALRPKEQCQMLASLYEEYRPLSVRYNALHAAAGHTQLTEEQQAELQPFYRLHSQLSHLYQQLGSSEHRNILAQVLHEFSEARQATPPRAHHAEVESSLYNVLCYALREDNTRQPDATHLNDILDTWYRHQTRGASRRGRAYRAVINYLIDDFPREQLSKLMTGENALSRKHANMLYDRLISQPKTLTEFLRDASIPSHIKNNLWERLTTKTKPRYFANVLSHWDNATTENDLCEELKAYFGRAEPRILEAILNRLAKMITADDFENSTREITAAEIAAINDTYTTARTMLVEKITANNSAAKAQRTALFAHLSPTALTDHSKAIKLFETLNQWHAIPEYAPLRNCNQLRDHILGNENLQRYFYNALINDPSNKHERLYTVLTNWHTNANNRTYEALRTGLIRQMLRPDYSGDSTLTGTDLTSYHRAVDQALERQLSSILRSFSESDANNAATRRQALVNSILNAGSLPPVTAGEAAIGREHIKRALSTIFADTPTTDENAFVLPESQLAAIIHYFNDTEQTDINALLGDYSEDPADRRRGLYTAVKRNARLAERTDYSTYAREEYYNPIIREIYAQTDDTTPPQPLDAGVIAADLAKFFIALKSLQDNINNDIQTRALQAGNQFIINLFNSPSELPVGDKSLTETFMSLADDDGIDDTTAIQALILQGLIAHSSAATTNFETPAQINEIIRQISVALLDEKDADDNSDPVKLAALLSHLHRNGQQNVANKIITCIYQRFAPQDRDGVLDVAQAEVVVRRQAALTAAEGSQQERYAVAAHDRASTEAAIRLQPRLQRIIESSAASIEDQTQVRVAILAGALALPNRILFDRIADADDTTDIASHYARLIGASTDQASINLLINGLVERHPDVAGNNDQTNIARAEERLADYNTILAHPAITTPTAARAAKTARVIIAIAQCDAFNAQRIFNTSGNTIFGTGYANRIALICALATEINREGNDYSEDARHALQYIVRNIQAAYRIALLAAMHSNWNAEDNTGARQHIPTVLSDGLQAAEAVEDDETALTPQQVAAARNLGTLANLVAIANPEDDGTDTDEDTDDEEPHISQEQATTLLNYLLDTLAAIQSIAHSLELSYMQAATAGSAHDTQAGYDAISNFIGPLSPQQRIQILAAMQARVGPAAGEDGHHADAQRTLDAIITRIANTADTRLSLIEAAAAEDQAIINAIIRRSVDEHGTAIAGQPTVENILVGLSYDADNPEQYQANAARILIAFNNVVTAPHLVGMGQQPIRHLFYTTDAISEDRRALVLQGLQSSEVGRQVIRAIIDNLGPAQQAQLLAELVTPSLQFPQALAAVVQAIRPDATANNQFVNVFRRTALGEIAAFPGQARLRILQHLITYEPPTHVEALQGLITHDDITAERLGNILKQLHEARTSNTYDAAFDGFIRALVTRIGEPADGADAAPVIGPEFRTQLLANAIGHLASLANGDGQATINHIVASLYPYLEPEAALESAPARGALRPEPTGDHGFGSILGALQTNPARAALLVALAQIAGTGVPLANTYPNTHPDGAKKALVNIINSATDAVISALVDNYAAHAEQVHEVIQQLPTTERLRVLRDNAAEPTENRLIEALSQYYTNNDDHLADDHLATVHAFLDNLSIMEKAQLVLVLAARSNETMDNNDATTLLGIIEHLRATPVQLTTVLAHWSASADGATCDRVITQLIDSETITAEQLSQLIVALQQLPEDAGNNALASIVTQLKAGDPASRHQTLTNILHHLGNAAYPAVGEDGAAAAADENAGNALQAIVNQLSAAERATLIDLMRTTDEQGQAAINHFVRAIVGSVDDATANESLVALLAAVPDAAHVENRISILIALRSCEQANRIAGLCNNINAIPATQRRAILARLQELHDQRVRLDTEDLAGAATLQALVMPQVIQALTIVGALATADINDANFAAIFANIVGSGSEATLIENLQGAENQTARRVVIDYLITRTERTGEANFDLIHAARNIDKGRIAERISNLIVPRDALFQHIGANGQRCHDFLMNRDVSASQSFQDAYGRRGAEHINPLNTSLLAYLNTAEADTPNAAHHQRIMLINHIAEDGQRCYEFLQRFHGDARLCEALLTHINGNEVAQGHLFEYAATQTQVNLLPVEWGNASTACRGQYRTLAQHFHERFDVFRRTAADVAWIGRGVYNAGASAASSIYGMFAHRQQQGDVEPAEAVIAPDAGGAEAPGAPGAH